MNVRETRRILRIVMGVLIGFNVLAASALIYMWVRGTSALPEQFSVLHQQVQKQKAIVIPPEKVDARVKEAREQIAKFYEDRFPNSSAAIFEDLGRLAAENKVHLNDASYNVEDSELPGLRQVIISGNLTGDYVQAMKFINALERQKTFFIVDSVNLGEQAQNEIHLNIRIETYMRGET
jgi:type IV pilus assembly protein PilO